MHSAAERPHHSQSVDASVFGVALGKVGEEVFEPEIIVGCFFTERVTPQDGSEVLVDFRS